MRKRSSRRATERFSETVSHRLGFARSYSRAQRNARRRVSRLCPCGPVAEARSGGRNQYVSFRQRGLQPDFPGRRLGREVLTPLETGQLIATDKVGARGSLPASEAAFLSVGGDGFEIETLKPAEDGPGYVLQLLETSGRAHTVQIGSRLFEVERVWETNAVEDDRREIPIGKDGTGIALPASGIVTLRMSLRLRAP